MLPTLKEIFKTRMTKHSSLSDRLPADRLPANQMPVTAGVAAFSVLLVDDSAVSLRGMARVLREHWEINLASGAEEALVLAKNNSYAVVITDCDMPGRDGIWLLEQIRIQSPNAIRVLASANEPERFASHLKSGLIHILLHKPLSSDSLCNLLIGLMMR